MKNIITKTAVYEDIPCVLTLQSANLYSNLTTEARESGFVTTPFTIPQLQEIIDLNGLFIAKDADKIIAYAFAGSWDYFSQWAIFPFMTARFPDLSFKNFTITTENSFEYGPVCIDVNYRGQGLLNQIFETMRLAMLPKYPLSITFINAVNERSRKAHVEKLGWEIIDEFEFNGKQYLGLAFDMKESVF